MKRDDYKNEAHVLVSQPVNNNKTHSNMGHSIDVMHENNYML